MQTVMGTCGSNSTAGEFVTDGTSDLRWEHAKGKRKGKWGSILPCLAGARRGVMHVYATSKAVF